MIKTKSNFPFYSLLKNVLLIGVDYCAYVTSVVIAISVRKILPLLAPFLDFPVFSEAIYFVPEINIFMGITLLVFIWNSLYQKRRSFWEELLVLWKSIIVSALISYLFLFNFDEILPSMSRSLILFLFLSMMLIIPLYRLMLKKILFTILFWRTPMLIVCKIDEIEKAQKIARIFLNDSYLGFVPVAFCIENYPSSEIVFDEVTLPVYKDKNQLPLNLTILVIGDVFTQDTKGFSQLYGKYRKIYIVPNKDIMGLSGSGVQYLFTERLFIMKLENQLNSYFARMTKFLMDRILGVLFILILSPLFIILMILIKIYSPGSVFYRQERVGKGGKTFKMWKFRSMYQNADQKLKDLLASDPELQEEWDTYFKLKKDPRITPIGNILRKYSLDEFPQLFNVLTGEMSLVGPRPFVRGEIEELNASLLPLYAQVKPGLTGLWQVSGRNEIDRLERMNIDVWYIQNWSPSLDLLILLNTPLAVMSARGAS